MPGVSGADFNLPYIPCSGSWPMAPSRGRASPGALLLGFEPKAYAVVKRSSSPLPFRVGQVANLFVDSIRGRRINRRLANPFAQRNGGLGLRCFCCFRRHGFVISLEGILSLSRATLENRQSHTADRRHWLLFSYRSPLFLYSQERG